MDNKDKIIEEMAKEIEKAKQHIWESVRTQAEDEDYLWHSRAIAEHLILQGYRKLPKDSVVISQQEYLNIVTKIRAEFEYEYKDSVVLSREEFDTALKNQYQEGCSNTSKFFYELMIPKTRKETVEKILFDLVGHTFECDGWTYTVDVDDIKWLADKYKVEIKE